MERYQRGSLQQIRRKNGVKVWTFRWYEQDGDKRTYRKRVIGTVAEMPQRRDAEKALVQLRQNINSGSRPPQTVAELIDHYKKHELVDGKKSASSIYVNTNFLALYVAPTWGATRLENVRTVEVEDWLQSLDYAPGTRAKIRNIMSALFNHGIRHEWIAANPITRVRCSAKRLRTPDVLTPPEFRLLLGELELRDRAMALLAGNTGLRRSELVALTWGDVSFTCREVTVRRSCVKGKFGDTKTEASRKPVPLPASAAEELLRWRSASPFADDSDFLFPSVRKNGKQPLTPDMLLKRIIRPAAVRAGINKRIGWHTFRHSLATNLRSLGVDVKVAQEMLRHANSRITMDIYTQAVSLEKHKAASQIAGLLEGPNPLKTLEKTA